MFFLSWALAGPAQPAPVEATFQLVVFDRAPDLELRQKFVRRAMTKSKTLQSGKDWGRALCFQFDGPSDSTTLKKALAKLRMKGEVRSAEGCVEPPKEALLPPEPIAVRRVVFKQPIDPNVARDGLRYLFDVDLGISGLQTARTASKNICIELQENLGNEELFFVLQASELPIERVEKASSCGLALQAR